ncbi:MAG: hypothetical protein FWG10_09220 [Eubacteriaceae bacterium]|nr:hypothetical protein [Eubacteriaceae bacterium]
MKNLNTQTARDFFISKNGRLTISVILYFIIWSAAYSLWMSGGDASIIVIAICAFFGWRSHSSIQPAMFVWMSWMGFFVYLFVKFLLSAIIGLFVAPWVIGKWISERVYNVLL